MAEIGVAASVIDLINTGFALGKFINDAYNAYKSAPAEVLEIATEVYICCELMQPLGEQLQAGSVRYTKRFKTSILALVQNSKDTFNDIRSLIPSNADGTIDRGLLPRWTYVLNKPKIAKYRQRLAEIRQMFLFIKQAMNEAPRPEPHAQGGASDDNPQAQPVVLTGPGTDALGNSIMFQAVLSMHFVGTPATTRKSAAATLALDEIHRPPDYLKTLRQDPYFSPDLLGVPGKHTAVEHDQAEPAVEVIEYQHVASRISRVDERVERKATESAWTEEPGNPSLPAWEPFSPPTVFDETSRRHASLSEAEKENHLKLLQLQNRTRYAYARRPSDEVRVHEDVVWVGVITPMSLPADKISRVSVQASEEPKRPLESGEETKSTKSELESDGTDDIIPVPSESKAIPDGSQAASDVQAYIESWFGEDEEAGVPVPT